MAGAAAGAAGISPALLLAAAAFGVACQANTDGACADHVRPIGLDDANATNMTVRDIGARFHVGDVVWSCALSWGKLGDQTIASWSPHDTTTAARVSLRWGPGDATETTGTTPSDSRGYCPPAVSFDLILDVATDDGGLADSWSATGRYVQGLDSLGVNVDPWVSGGFKGSYAFALAPSEDWPQRSTTISVNAAPARLDGSLTESAQRPTGANQAEGFGLNTAAWMCDQSTPAP